MSQFTLKITDAYSKDVRLVFTSGKSIRDMLVSSSFGTRDCPKTIYERNETREKGRPPECRACDAGIPSGRCMDKRVVYSMFCSLCKAEYVGETERCLRDRFQEHHRQARALAPNTPCGVHFAYSRPDAQHTVPPFTGATILASVPCHVNRRTLEAVFIRDRQPAVNRDCGWVLIWSHSFLPRAIIKLFAEIGGSVTNVNWLICKLVL